jgi:hypothetical protein
MPLPLIPKKLISEYDNGDRIWLCEVEQNEGNSSEQGEKLQTGGWMCFGKDNIHSRRHRRERKFASYAENLVKRAYAAKVIASVSSGNPNG